MKNLSFEKIIIFYISPVLPFIFSHFYFPLADYIVRVPAIAFVLLILLIQKKIKDDSRKIFSFLFILLSICLIEYFHYFINGRSIDGLGDVRLILYNPLYGRIIIFTLYALYLYISSDIVRNFHLKFSINFYSKFSLFFVVYWFLLYLGLIPNLSGSSSSLNYLNANAFSYLSLFIFFCLTFYKDKSPFSEKKTLFFKTINILVIFLNTTRGAILILLCLFGLIIYKKLKLHYGIIFSNILSVFFVFASSILLFTAIGVQNKMMNGQMFEIYNNYKNVELNEIKAVDKKIRSLNFDNESSFSSISRIGTNYFAFISFLEHPLLGVGSAESLSISVFGNSLHSFLFLLLTSTGLLGAILFCFLVARFVKKFYSSINKVNALFLVVMISIFQNQIDPYFAILFLIRSDI